MVHHLLEWPPIVGVFRAPRAAETALGKVQNVLSESNEFIAALDVWER
jgi:hypothetical protein